MRRRIHVGRGRAHDPFLFVLLSIHTFALEVLVQHLAHHRFGNPSFSFSPFGFPQQHLRRAICLYPAFCNLHILHTSPEDGHEFYFGKTWRMGAFVYTLGALRCKGRRASCQRHRSLFQPVGGVTTNLIFAFVWALPLGRSCRFRLCGCGSLHGCHEVSHGDSAQLHQFIVVEGPPWCVLWYSTKLEGVILEVKDGRASASFHHGRPVLSRQGLSAGFSGEAQLVTNSFRRYFWMSM